MTVERELVAVLGGTFDPVHVGHLHIARQVAAVFDLRRVFLVPCHRQPHKPQGPVASAADRLEMVRLAVAGETVLQACAIEVERGGISYTIDTLDAIRAKGLTPLFVVGLDSVADLSTWRDHVRLRSDFDLVAVDRAGTSVVGKLVPVACRPHAAKDVPGGRPGLGGRIFHLPAATIDVSSSLVRARAATGTPIVGLVPPAVARYIQEHGLYAKEMNR